MFDEATVRVEDRLALAHAVVADDDRLAAAERQPRERVLVGHAARQAQRVGDGLSHARVIPETRAADRGAENGAVDGDDAAIIRPLVLAGQQKLVPAVRL